MATKGPTGLLSNRVFWVVALFIALFLVVVAVAQSNGKAEPEFAEDSAASTKSPAAASDPQPSADGGTPEPGSQVVDSPVVKRDPQDPQAMGQVDAPVVVTVWTDFRCPFCAVWNTQTLPVLADEYVKTGKVRFEFRDVAFFGEDSAKASAAALAAGDQGKFVEYMNAVYAAAPQSGHPAMPPAKLLGFAKTAGVPDLDLFEKAMSEPARLQEAQQHTMEAQQSNITSVPFFYTGETSLAGAQPVDVFRSWLDDAVAKAEAAQR